MTGKVLSVRNLTQTYGSGAATHLAVDDVSFEITEGETLGLVGESGCGKSSTARAVLGIAPPKSGEVLLDGQDLASVKGRQRRTARSKMQLVFQDPYNSVNPRWTVRQVVAEPLRIQRVPAATIREKVDAQLATVGLDPERFGDRSARQLSGGQAQRVGIARALITNPRLLVCDEAVSALDVSIQAQILNLFMSLKADLGLTSLFISHDLGVVKHVSDRVAVMYLGRIVEIGSADALFGQPLHPYTSVLMDSVLEVGGGRPHSVASKPESEVVADSGTSDPALGCPFRDRCAFAQQICHVETPLLQPADGEHRAACHFPGIARAS